MTNSGVDHLWTWFDGLNLHRQEISTFGINASNINYELLGEFLGIFRPWLSTEVVVEL